MKSIIVAYDKYYGIGAKNDLPWGRDLPADLRHFKETTTGHAVIMGYNTYKSIVKPLSNRRNIIICEKPIKIEGFEIVGSLKAAYELAAGDSEIFVIGGAMTYLAAIDTVDRIYATEVKASFDNIDTVFPMINKKMWREVSREKHRADELNSYDYDFVVYDRVNDK